MVLEWMRETYPDENDMLRQLAAQIVKRYPAGPVFAYGAVSPRTQRVRDMVAGWFAAHADPAALADVDP